MEIPMIDFNDLHGEKRSQTMALLDQACEKWGCFQIKNHGIDTELMEKVKQMVNTHYEQNLKQQFYESEIAKRLESKGHTSDVDWESSFFIWHRPVSNMETIQNLPNNFCATVNEYIAQVIKLAEKLSELMCENLGLEKEQIKHAFCGAKGPSVGTKVAKYPQCPNPSAVRGLREHTDAGGLILLLQDDRVAGLEFLHGGEWVPIPPPARDGTIFVNTGDQIEILTNGRYKSVLHRVMADRDGCRLSIATFYNPAGDAVIAPAARLVYPGRFRFRDYLELYGATKFGDKGTRFETMKEMGGKNGCLG